MTTRFRTLAARPRGAICRVRRRRSAGATLAHQGPRQYRGRAPEPADRLRPGRRPQRHRRHAQQLPFTKQIAAGDAGAARRQHPRRQTMRTGNVAAVMVTANLPAFGTQGTRIDVTVSALGDCQEPAGRHAAGHPAARRRRQGLCGGAGLASRSAASRPRATPPRSRAACRPSAASPTARSSSARSNSSSTGCKHAAAGAAQPRLHHRQAHRRRDQRLHRRATTAEPTRSLDRAASPIPPQYRRQHGRAPHRDRAAAGRARPGRQDRHRRALRHHRHGPRRARLHRRGRAGQPHRHHHRDSPQVSQPNAALARRTTAVVPRTNIGVDTRTARSSRSCDDGVSLQQLVDGLNALGIGPRDLIAILQAIKAAGAIQADIEVM